MRLYTVGEHLYTAYIWSVRSVHPNLTAALAYANAGIAIIPCYYDPATGKKPPIHHKDHFQRASCDPLVITAWFNTPNGGWQMPGVFVKNEHILIGLPTGAHSGYEVIDIDVKQDIDGHLTVPGWEHLAMVIVETPTGGHHLYHRHAPKLRLKNEAGQVVYDNKKVSLPGIDIRSTGGYVILPGSTLPDSRAYRWFKGSILTSEGKKNELLTEVDLERLTLKVREGVQDQRERNKRKAKLELVEGEDHYEQRAITWLSRLAADVAESLPGTRDETLKDKLHAGGCVVHAGLASAEEYGSIFWSAVKSCGLDRELTPAAFDKKVQDALHSSKGTSLPAHLQRKDWLREMNQQHFVIANDGDKLWVGEWVWDTDKRNRKLSLQRKSDFLDRYANQMVKVGDETQPLGKAWFTSRGRRQYHSIFFDPSAPLEQDTDEEGKVQRLNLWRGLALQEKAGAWNRVLGHAYRVLARRDPVIFRYLVRWSAWCVINPGQPAGVAVVLRGGQGVGKGLYARALVEIFGQHGMQVTRADDLVGKFNEHLRDCCFLFADEAVSPRDIAAASQLKAIITEERLTIRGLFKKAVKDKNVVKVIMASNEAHVTHVESDDRRNAVFECELELGSILGGRFKTRKEYFDWLYKQLTDEGYAAMLHDLLRVDVSSWHPRDQVPETAAREEQKDLTRNPLFEVLEEYLAGQEGMITFLEVVKLCGVQHNQLQQKHKNWIGQTMRELRWEAKRVRYKESDVPGRGDLVRAYVKGDPRALLTAQDLKDAHAGRLATIQAELEREREDELRAAGRNADEVRRLFDDREGKEPLQ